MRFIAEYKNAHNRLLLLDYDGTLVNFRIVPDEAKPSVRVLNILYKLSCHPTTKVVVITGRDYRGIDRMIGHLPITIIAEHGSMIKEHGMWTDRVRADMQWKNAFLPTFQRYMEECKGSFVEEKRFSLAWHYRNVDMVTGYIYSRDLIHEVQDRALLHNLRIIDGSKTLEIVTAGADKGNTVISLVKERKYDVVLCIGDGTTDEDMFRLLKDREGAITVKVGYGKSDAEYRLDSPDEVVELLEQL